MELRHQLFRGVRSIFTLPWSILHRGIFILSDSFNDSEFLRVTQQVTVMNRQFEFISIRLKRNNALMDFLVVISHRILGDMIPVAIKNHYLILNIALLLRSQLFLLSRKDVIQEIYLVNRIHNVHFFKPVFCGYLFSWRSDIFWQLTGLDNVGLSVSQNKNISRFLWML